ncbi:hypothetical protein [Viscerimonas tarda]
MEKLELYKYVESCIKEKFNFLDGYGYGIYSDYNDTDRYSDYGDLRITYENKNIDRVFSIRYIYMYKEKTLDSFSFYVENISTTNGIFFINDYMLFIQKQKIKYLWLNSFEGTFEDKLDQLLDYIVEILQAYLVPVLKGEEWVDVPTNWYGAK